MLLLYEVDELKITGIFDFELLKNGRVYSSRFIKDTDNLHCFTLLCIVNYEHFIIEVKFADILVDKMNNDI